MDSLLFLSAMFAGFLGSGHCLGMCGGIAGALGMQATGSGQVYLTISRFHLGRLFSYMLIGGAVAALAGGVGRLSGLQNWALGLRLVTAAMLFLLGIQYLFRWYPLAWLERGGSLVWRRFTSVVGAPRLSAMGIGLFWGMLPCGLLYSMLAMAASTGQFLPGALVMLGFGLGTLPSMLGASMAASTLARLRHERAFQIIVGIFMLLFAFTTALFAFLHAGHIGHQHMH